MRFLILLLAIFITPANSFGTPEEQVGATAEYQGSITDFAEVVNAEAAMFNVESRVRDAAVKVVTMGGHGSGTYMIFRGHHIVLTAQHVVDDFKAVTIRNESGAEVPGKVIYTDEKNDIAAVLVEGIESSRPMRFRIASSMPRPGTEIFYSGYPASHNLLSIRGIVSGYNGTPPSEQNIIIFGYGWFGCSGSGIYDERGNLIGILWGVDVRNFGFGQQVVEDLIWVSSSLRIDQEKLIQNICSTEHPRSMRGDISCRGVSAPPETSQEQQPEEPGGN